MTGKGEKYGQDPAPRGSSVWAPTPPGARLPSRPTRQPPPTIPGARPQPSYRAQAVPTPPRRARHAAPAPQPRPRRASKSGRGRQALANQSARRRQSGCIIRAPLRSGPAARVPWDPPTPGHTPSQARGPLTRAPPGRASWDLPWGPRTRAEGAVQGGPARRALSWATRTRTRQAGSPGRVAGALWESVPSTVIEFGEARLHRVFFPLCVCVCARAGAGLKTIS